MTRSKYEFRVADASIKSNTLELFKLKSNHVPFRLIQIRNYLNPSCKILEDTLIQKDDIDLGVLDDVLEIRAAATIKETH